MKYNLLFIFSLLIFNTSCEKKLEKKVNKEYSYGMMSIDEGSHSIRIHDYSDSIQFIHWKKINDYTSKSFKISKKDKKILEGAMHALIQVPELRKNLKQNTRQIISQYFDKNIVWRELKKEYDRLM